VGRVNAYPERTTPATTDLLYLESTAPESFRVTVSALRNVTTSTTDTTSDRVTRTRDYGWGLPPGVGPANNPTVNNPPATGTYTYSANPDGFLPSTFGGLLTFRGSAARYAQIAISTATPANRMYFRQGDDGSNAAWFEVTRVGDFGLGLSGTAAGVSIPGNNFNNAIPTGFYGSNTAVSSLAGRPASETASWLWSAVVAPRSGTTAGGRTVFLTVHSTQPRLWMGTRADETGPLLWTRVFTPSTLVGTVSQSGGVATGDVIERGAVSGQGEFVRFADGSQICSHVLVFDSAITTAFSGGFRTAAQTWTYPAEFVGTVAVSVGARNLTAFGGVTTTIAGTTSVGAALTSVTSDATVSTRRAEVLAFGRWF
jgi:hypothetical protein